MPNADYTYHVPALPAAAPSYKLLMFNHWAVAITTLVCVLTSLIIVEQVSPSGPFWDTRPTILVGCMAGIGGLSGGLVQGLVDWRMSGSLHRRLRAWLLISGIGMIGAVAVIAELMLATRGWSDSGRAGMWLLSAAIGAGGLTLVRWHLLKSCNIVPLRWLTATWIAWGIAAMMVLMSMYFFGQ